MSEKQKVITTQTIPVSVTAPVVPVSEPVAAVVPPKAKRAVNPNNILVKAKLLKDENEALKERLLELEKKAAFPPTPAASSEKEKVTVPAASSEIESDNESDEEPVVPVKKSKKVKVVAPVEDAESDSEAEPTERKQKVVYVGSTRGFSLKSRKRF